VRTGTTVALFISSGPPPARVTIPAVRGLPAAQARSLLADLGLRVTRAGAPSEQVPSGSATGSQPRAGSRVARGARVTLLVSSGPPPAGKVSVPAVRDLPERRAIARLREAGLDAIAEPRASETVPAGRALGTVPAAGTSVDRGARVRLVISSGTAVERATIPQLAGNSFEDARSRLEQLRLIAQRRAIDSSEPAGAVVSSDPAAGSSVPVGSTVILAVSSGTLVRVPDVVGAPARTAAAEIKRAGLSPAEHDVVSDQPDGTVTSTDPKAGSEVPRGSEVVYDVSCGPTPCID
jgi:serine/threonine-protein kinase